MNTLKMVLDIVRYAFFVRWLEATEVASVIAAYLPSFSKRNLPKH